MLANTESFLISPSERLRQLFAHFFRFRVGPRAPARADA
jgi:hypothetical protein